MNSSGLIGEQGRFSDLIRKDGYVSRLNLSTSQNLPQALWDEHTEKDLPSSINTTNNQVDNSEDEICVHSKPAGVYRFYIKAVGGLMCLVYLLLALVYSFLFNFPRRLLHDPICLIPVLTMDSDLGEMVGRNKRKAARIPPSVLHGHLLNAPSPVSRVSSATSLVSRSLNPGTHVILTSDSGTL
jgi:hypothetical protein